MSEMIERVKAAMVATELDCAGWCDEAIMELAIAAIQAMRLPTEDMICAACDKVPMLEMKEARWSWEAMIDAALTVDGPTPTE